MKQILITLITLMTLMASAFMSTGHNLYGSWSGELNVGAQKLMLVVNISELGGKDVCTLDSPDQGAKGIPAELKTINDSIVDIAIPIIGASFKGNPAAGKISGQFTQHGYSFPMTLTKGTIKPVRPQNPSKPYGYTTEDVAFYNDDVKLSGTLTFPVGYKHGDKPTVVLMISGSGAQNRDEELFDHKPFLVIADWLARNGIASLRYDDRGVGKSSGNSADATIEGNMQDANAGITYLRKLGKFDKVGAIGHSEGGTIAIMLAKRNAVDFVVSLAGMMTSGKELLLQQNKDLLLASGIPQKDTNEYCTALGCVFDSIVKGKKHSDPIAEIKIIEAKLNLNLSDSQRTNLASIIRTDNKWLKSVLKYNIADDIKGVKCPVLALNGTKDIQVKAEMNLENLRKLLPPTTLAVIEPVPGVNHLFQPCTTGNITEYGRIATTISPYTLSKITDTITTFITTK